jgi:hypothetical protein
VTANVASFFKFERDDAIAHPLTFLQRYAEHRIAHDGLCAEDGWLLTNTTGTTKIGLVPSFSSPSLDHQPDVNQLLRTVYHWSERQVTIHPVSESDVAFNPYALIRKIDAILGLKTPDTGRVVDTRIQRVDQKSYLSNRFDPLRHRGVGDNSFIMLLGNKSVGGITYNQQKDLIIILDVWVDHRTQVPGAYRKLFQFVLDKGYPVVYYTDFRWWNPSSKLLSSLGFNADRVYDPRLRVFSPGRRTAAIPFESIRPEVGEFRGTDITDCLTRQELADRLSDNGHKFFYDAGSARWTTRQ